MCTGEIKQLLENDGCALVVDLSGFFQKGKDDPKDIEASKHIILNLEPPENEGGPLLSIRSFPDSECLIGIIWKDKGVDCSMEIPYFSSLFFLDYTPRSLRIWRGPSTMCHKSLRAYTPGACESEWCGRAGSDYLEGRFP